MKVLILLLGLMSSTFAHTGVHEAGGFIQGLMHPISGLDHILAMVGVGMVAYYASQKGLLAIGAFMAAMILAAILGYSGMAMFGVEEGILLSIAVIFLLVGFASKIPTYFVAIIVAFFGFFHGFAHGAEFEAGSFISFIVGFSISTLILHLSGLALAHIYNKKVMKIFPSYTTV